MGTVSFMIGTDHVVPVEPYGGSAVATVDQTGGTVYYADNPQVSAGSNQGSIAPGGSQTFTSNAWLIASALAGVKVQTTSVWDESAQGVQQYNAIGVGAAPKSTGLFVTGDADASIGALSFVKATGVDGHAMTVFYSPTTGPTQAALNVVSANPQFSSMEVTGVETAHGTIKIAHVGPNDQSDANAAAISIDLQTAAAGTGTAAQGIFITSTTDTNSTTLGAAISIRLNALDWFHVQGRNVAGQGVVHIGSGTGHTPAAMLELFQKDTTTPAFRINAISGGTDMVSLRDSGAIVRLKVDNAGNLTHNASVGFFNKTPAVQQTGGVLTAAATYGTNEQSMLQTAFNALRTFGFLS